MNRNLANSMPVFVAIAVVLLAALVYVTPTGSAASFPEQQASTIDTLDPDSGPPAPAPTSRATGGGSGSMARALAMPYFSLVTRG